jgi:hypothetical protein
MLHQFVELKKVVEEFRVWAKGYPGRDRSGEWECDYEQWPKTTTAFCAYLDAGPPQQWDDEVVDLLLYILARDNESEVLKDELANRPIHLMALAKAGIQSTERDARWQLADALGRAGPQPIEGESLLLRFVGDDDEYVSRRALLALGRRQSPKAEMLAQRAWETNDEYQRMAALDVLSTLNAPTLSAYLTLAQKDGREHLARFAAEVALRHGKA